jgi:hypothetical protein
MLVRAAEIERTRLGAGDRRRRRRADWVLAGSKPIEPDPLTSMKGFDPETS